MKRLMFKNPNMRLSACEAINHIWVQAKGIDEDDHRFVKQGLMTFRKFMRTTELQRAVFSYVSHFVIPR